MRVAVAIKGERETLRGCRVSVELADAPSEKAVIHSFSESSESDTIAFLLPTPLREKAGEFETGSQMAARHMAWAKAATGGKPVQLHSFTFVTALWGHYDPGLARQEIETLKLLGFNIIGGYDGQLLQKACIRTYATTWNYNPSTKVMDEAWEKAMGGRGTSSKVADPTARPAHYVLSDEVQTLDFRSTDPNALNSEFRDYLRSGNGIGGNAVHQRADHLVGQLLERRAFHCPARERVLQHAQIQTGLPCLGAELRHARDIKAAIFRDDDGLRLRQLGPYFCDYGLLLLQIKTQGLPPLLR